jgi:hypothetical protein
MQKVKADQSNKQSPKVHQELAGFDIRINPFGEIISTIDIEKINAFLDDNVEDKKLTDREVDEVKSHEK